MELYLLYLHGIARQPDRSRPEDDLACVRGLLEALRLVDDAARDERAARSRIADEDVARIQAEARLEPKPTIALQFRI